jgi:hypothetical protein
LRGALRDTSKHLMSTAIRPLAEVISTLPLGDPSDARRAGPSFEIYSDIELSPFAEVRGRIALERFDPLIAAAAQLAAMVPRAAAVADTLRLIRRKLAIAFGV